MKQFLRYTLTLVAILIATTPAWAATATLSAKSASVTADGITFSLGGDYNLNTLNLIANYSSTGSGKEASLSWTVPTGYTISVSQIMINAKNDKALFGSTTGKGQYKTSKYGTYTQFCNSNSWTNYTLNSSSYFPLGNGGSITLKAVDRELQWKDIVFTYTKTAHKYNIVFDANGGTGTTSGISNVSYDTNVNLTPNGFTRNKFIVTYDANGGSCSPTEEIRNYTFAGWAETSNGAVKYADKQSVKNLTSTNGATVTLYAKWNEPDNATLTLPTATKTGSVLEGWYLGDTKIGEAGDIYTPTSSVTLTAKWIEKYTPEIKGSDATILVGEEIPNAFTFKNTSNPTAIITKKSISDIRNGEDVITYDATENKIIAHNAGVAEIYFVQDPTSTIEGGTSATYTITVNKNTSYFTLNFAGEYFVDDQIAKSTFLVSPTNTEVAISVTDNKGYFSYTSDNLIANCRTQLPADNDTTTITVTQPENYKWTSYSLNKTVTVKKHTTDFAWQLQDSYFVGEEDASIFTKSDNNLASTITSSDPSVIEVVDNKLVMRKAGSAVITVSQATDRKWTDFSYTKTVNVVKRDLEAAIHQSSAVWNELISDPFTVSFKHPITGAVTTLTDYTVTQTEDSKLIAEYKSNNIQTYYTNGTVDFLITRPEDDNYNTFSQTLTLNVNQSTENCPILEDNNERSWSTFNNSGTYTIPSGRPDSLFFQAKRTAILGISNTSNFYAEYSTDNSNWTRAMTIDLGSTDTWYNLKCDIPETAKYIRFVTYMGATGNKQIRNVRVTRKEEINPSIVEGGTLKLPTVAFGKPSSNTFTLDWSTCTDIKISCDNSKFTISDENGTPITDITTNDGTQVLTVSCNTSEIGIYTDTITIYNQSRKVSFNVTDTVNDKGTPVMTGEESYSKKVGNTWTTNFTFKNTETATPSADKNAPFYFEIDHKSFVNTDRLTRNPNHLDEVISYNPDTYEITAHNAGTAVLTFVQQGNDGYYYSSRSCTITIDKNTPTFTWKDPVYFNQTISDYFTTNNNPNENEYATEVSITQESTDPDVAIIYFNQEDDTDKHSLDLTTYYKETSPESSTQVTVYQAENWYWNAKEEPHTITPKNKNNHVSNTPITETNLNDFKIEYQDPWNNPWTNDGIHFGEPNIGGDDGGWNWNDKYIIIEFTGVPDSLFFTTATTGSAGMDNPLDAGDNATNNKFFYVSAGTSKDNLNEIWSSTSQTNTYKEKLDPSVRFLKLCYTGNLEGWFKNVRITELNQFDAVPNSLDFGTVTLDDNPSKALNFNLHYANAGYNVTLDLDRTGGWATEEAYNLAKQYIRMEPATITTIGGEKHGTVENILVTLHSDDQTGYTIPANARLKISDEAGHTTYVNLSGKIEKSTQTITWNDYFSLQEPIQIPISTDSVRGAAKASSNLPVKYRSADDAVIKVNDNGLCFIPAGVGTTTITAYQEGNNQYAYVESTKQVQVTGKSIQLINWTDDLSDLIFYQDTEDPDSIALTAQVYIIDVVNSTFEFSQEQTDKLIYTIAEGGESIIKITNDTLTMLGIGETTITVTIEADEQHEGATMTIPVIVREPAMGCEDKILITPPSQIEFFQMNTDEISKDAIAINRAEGVPGFLLFSHIGKQWTILGMNFYTGTIKAQQSTDGGNTWQDVAGSEITPTLNKEQQTDSILLDRNATHIRFVRPAGGQGYHYVTNIKVVPVQYVEVEQNTIDFENINMGGVYQKTFTISYSNIKSPLIATTSSKDVTVEPNRWGECGDFGSKEFTVTWKPNNNQNQSITIQDTLADLSVTINLQANIQLRKQKIVWENRPTAILDHTGIDNRPLYTRDANNNELLDLPITYEVTNGSDLAYFENGMFFIINTGEITIKASNLGNNEYLAVDSTYQLIIQGIPPTFIGSTEAGADSLWTNQNNWVNGLMPTKDNTANIVAPVQVNTVINVQGIRVAEEGSIHITSTGGLTVGEGGIQTVTTDGSAIVIDNLHSGAGFFRINPNCEDELPRITMRYQTKSTLDNGANKDAEWQYIGAPGEDASVHVDYNTWLYRLDESQADWVLMPQLNNHTLDPFQGYALTQYGQPTYEWNAQMINRNCTIPLTYHFDGRKGQNLIANSYTAPIDVTQMTSKDFQMIDGQNEYYDITQTLYLYNSGSWNAWHTQDSLGTGINLDGNNTTPGQYYAIPVLAVAKGYIPEKPTIAPMQGIYVRVRAKKTGGDTHVGNIIFDYDRIVMGEGHDMHRPMRAPKKSDIASIPSENFRRLRIVATSEHSGADRLYIIQDDINTRNYDNGYDAPNQATQGIVNIYTYESGGKMEVSCANNIDSTYIGFMAGEDRTYTLHFNTIVGETLCLQDLTNGEKINIVEGGTYTFEAEPQSTNNQRFLLLAPQGIKSDIDEIDSVNIWYSNRTLYITNAADNSTLQLYDVSGHQIFSTTIHHTPYTVDLTHLNEGVYMARVNNQVYKFVCK